MVSPRRRLTSRTRVWSLALGPTGRVMPERVITKPPSAELKPDQTDQDTLPPYEQLDAILECLIEHEMPVADIVARGHENEERQGIRPRGLIKWNPAKSKGSRLKSTKCPGEGGEPI